MPVTQAINKATDKWLQERQEAPLDKVKNWASKTARQLGAGPILDAASERVDTLTAGKRLLDEGGDAAELAVLAKKVACDAVAGDLDIIDKIQTVIGLYEEAAALLQNSTAGLAQFSRLVQAYTERASIYSKVLNTVGQAPEAPPMTPVEWDATKFLQLRLAKAHLGLRQQVGGALAEQAQPPANRRSRSSQRLCLDDHAPPALQDQPRASSAPRSPGDSRTETLDRLLQELFRLQDLKGNNVLEEAELVKLNEKIAMLHYGKDIDKTAVRKKFQTLFRHKLDPDGRPVPFSTFRTYMMQVLNELDTDPRAQEMILEQFIAEAESAREAFNFQSFASASDAPFMQMMKGPGARAETTLPTFEEESPCNERPFEPPSIVDLPENGNPYGPPPNGSWQPVPSNRSPTSNSTFSQGSRSLASDSAAEVRSLEAALPRPPPAQFDSFAAGGAQNDVHQYPSFAVGMPQGSFSVGPAGPPKGSFSVGRSGPPQGSFSIGSAGPTQGSFSVGPMPPRDSSSLSIASSGLPPTDLPVMQAPSTLPSSPPVAGMQDETLADRLARNPSTTSTSTALSEVSMTESVAARSPRQRSTNASRRGQHGAAEVESSSASGTYAVGDKVEVWSKTHTIWCPGVVHSVDGRLVNIKYTVPDGSGMVKILPRDDEQLRLWKADRPRGEAHKSPARREKSPSGADVGDPSMEPRFLNPSTGGANQYRSNMFTEAPVARGGHR